MILLLKITAVDKIWMFYSVGCYMYDNLQQEVEHYGISQIMVWATPPTEKINLELYT